MDSQMVYQIGLILFLVSVGMLLVLSVLWMIRFWKGRGKYGGVSLRKGEVFLEEKNRLKEEIEKVSVGIEGLSGFWEEYLSLMGGLKVQKSVWFRNEGGRYEVERYVGFSLEGLKMIEEKLNWKGGDFWVFVEAIVREKKILYFKGDLKVSELFGFLMEGYGFEECCLYFVSLEVGGVLILLGELYEGFGGEGMRVVLEKVKKLG